MPVASTHSFWSVMPQRAQWWAVVCAVLCWASVRADTVVFDAGGGQNTLQGSIVRETPDEVVILTDFNEEVRIARSWVKELKKDEPHPVKDCLALLEKARRAKTAEAWLELGRRAVKHDLRRFAREGWTRVIEAESENEEARLGLGHVKHRGRWRTRAEAQRADQWAERIGTMQSEFVGRPWATVAPRRTDHFEFKCNSTADVERRYVAFLEKALFPLYLDLFPRKRFQWYHEEPGKIYVMANAGEFRDYTLAMPGVGGFFRPDRNEVFSYHGSFGVRGTTLHVLAHECCHVFQWRICKEMTACPAWLMEGMAVYFGDGAKLSFSFRDRPEDFTKEGIAIEPPYDRVVLLKRMVQDERAWVPLERLLMTPHMQFSGLYYSPAWLAVYWCLDGSNYGAPPPALPTDSPWISSGRSKPTAASSTGRCSS